MIKTVNYYMQDFMPNIVIIDDDDDDSDLLKEAIWQVMPETHCFVEPSATGAVDKLNRKDVPKPDLIFLDLDMPVTNGVQCLLELKGNPELESVPVVIYTGSKSHDQRAQTLTSGANYFITKPASFREICRVVSEIFAQEIK